MKRFLRIGERYALSRLKNSLYLAFAITIQTSRQTKVIAVLLSLFLFIQESRANYSVPVKPTAGAVFSSTTDTGSTIVSPDSITSLQIGDTIPEALWNMPLTLWTAADSASETVTLGDYRGKLIILDFWATWCHACLYYMPHQFEFQRSFGNKIKALPITTEKKDHVASFLDRSSFKFFEGIKDELYSLVETDLLNTYFKAKSLPHIVVIGVDGRVEAITKPIYLTTEYFGELLAGTMPYIPYKLPVEELECPLLQFNTELGMRQYKPVSYSGLFGEIDGLDGRELQRIDSAQGLFYRLLANRTLVELYSVGQYPGSGRSFGIASPGDFVNRVMEVRDPTVYAHYYDARNGLRTVFDKDWNRSHRYSYESVRPLHSAADHRRQLVADLNSHTGLYGRMEVRRIPALVLALTGDLDTLRHPQNGALSIVVNGSAHSRVSGDTMRGPNEDGYTTYVEHMGIAHFAKWLHHTYNITLFDGSSLLLPAVTDETGLPSGFLVSLGIPDDPGTTLADLQRSLRKQGFELTETSVERPVFVLTEPGYEAPKDGRLVLTQFGYIPEANLKLLKHKYQQQ